MTPTDVEEAIRIFRVSTLAASEEDPALRSALSNGGAAGSESERRAEEFLHRRIAIRATVNAKRVLEEALSQGLEHDAVRRAVAAMAQRGELVEVNQRKMFRRIK